MHADVAHKAAHLPSSREPSVFICGSPDGVYPEVLERGPLLRVRWFCFASNGAARSDRKVLRASAINYRPCRLKNFGILEPLTAAFAASATGAIAWPAGLGSVAAAGALGKGFSFSSLK